MIYVTNILLFSYADNVIQSLCLPYLVCIQVQMLSSFEEKIKSVQTIDFSQYAGAHGLLPGKSAAEAKNVAAVNLRHEQRPVVASASVDAAVRTDQIEGRMYNALFCLPYADSSVYRNIEGMHG